MPDSLTTARCKSRRILGPMRWLSAVMLLPLAGGCATIQWVYFDFEQAEQLARERKTYVLAYYRWWASPECGAVEREVLNDPQVVAIFRNTVNCWLHHDWEPNRLLMTNRFRVQNVPAFVIMAPSGDFRKLETLPSVDQFLRFARTAMPEADEPQVSPEGGL